MTKLISWVEIPSVEIERAASFYSLVLKIDLQVMDLVEVEL